jgi:hypothetical protein
MEERRNRRRQTKNRRKGEKEEDEQRTGRRREKTQKRRENTKKEEKTQKKKRKHKKRRENTKKEEKTCSRRDSESTRRNEGENTNSENSEDEHVPQDEDRKHKTKKEKGRRRKEARNKGKRRDDEEDGDNVDSGESQESDVRGEKHVTQAVEVEEGSKNERREKKRGQRKYEVCAWHKGSRMRITKIYDQNIKKTPPRKQRGILEIENWNEIIDNRTILAGDFNAHDPLWGSHKTSQLPHQKPHRTMRTENMQQLPTYYNGIRQPITLNHRPHPHSRPYNKQLDNAR